ncbi:MAG: hypothetical protein LBD12_05505 [Clostridiales Family XIII bacterium]|nr:hypothetical protein [Clostridiales Family XIII bacterium]
MKRRQNRCMVGILCLFLACQGVGFAACSADTGNGTGLPATATVQTEKSENFKGFEASMNGAGIAFEKQEMRKMAGKIGARCGARYGFPGEGSLRVFQFEPSNENYIKIYNRKRVTLPDGEGGGTTDDPVVAYKGVVVIVEGFQDAGLVKQIMALVSDIWYGS